MKQLLGAFLIGNAISYFFLLSNIEIFLSLFAIVIGLNLTYESYKDKFAKGRKEE